jgi:hypothetical protein
MSNDRQFCTFSLCKFTLNLAGSNCSKPQLRRSASNTAPMRAAPELTISFTPLSTSAPGRNANSARRRWKARGYCFQLYAPKLRAVMLLATTR